MNYQNLMVAAQTIISNYVSMPTLTPRSHMLYDLDALFNNARVTNLFASYNFVYDTNTENLYLICHDLTGGAPRTMVVYLPMWHCDLPSFVRQDIDVALKLHTYHQMPPSNAHHIPTNTKPGIDDSDDFNVDDAWERGKQII